MSLLFATKRFVSATSRWPRSNGDGLSIKQMGLADQIDTQAAAHRIFFHFPIRVGESPRGMVNLSSKQSPLSIGTIQTIASREPMF